MKEKVISLLVSLALLITMMPQMVLGANGPGKGELPSYLRLISEKTDKFIFANFAQAKVEKVNGVTYNEKTNTLTLNNVKMKEYNLVANIMGDDFKINVKGENEVRSIFIWGDGYGGNLTISGDGKLVVNKQKLQETAINMRAEGTKGILTIESTVDMEMYSQKGYPVIETIGASNGDKTKAIAIKGKTSEKVNVKQDKEKHVIPENVKAYDVSEGAWLDKFKKDGKYYGGNAKYDDNMEKTGYYSMYEILENKEIEAGKTYLIAKPIKGQENIKPETKGYETVLDSDGEIDQFKGVVLMDLFSEVYLQMYHSTSDNKDYGVYTVHYIDDDHPDGVIKYTVFKIVDDSILGKAAILVPGKKEILELPKDLQQKIKGEYYSYFYTVNLEKLVLSKGTAPKPAVKKIGQAKISSAKNSKKKTVTLSWKKASNAKKYQIQYSLNKKFSKAKKYKTKTITSSKLKVTVKKLTGKKTYYFRVRGINGKNAGKWSAVKKVKITK